MRGRPKGDDKKTRKAKNRSKGQLNRQAKLREEVKMAGDFAFFFAVHAALVSNKKMTALRAESLAVACASLVCRDGLAVTAAYSATSDLLGCRRETVVSLMSKLRETYDAFFDDSSSSSSSDDNPSSDEDEHDETDERVAPELREKLRNVVLTIRQGPPTRSSRGP